MTTAMAEIETSGEDRILRSMATIHSITPFTLEYHDEKAFP